MEAPTTPQRPALAQFHAAAGATFSPVSPSGSSPEPPRQLRRKRSAANAALTTRPSRLTLGNLVPSLQTCVLVHTRHVQGKADRSLICALFEPNFFVDGRQRHVSRLDRLTWERLRAAVEELRIVSRSNSAGVPTPDASPTGLGPDCTFDLEDTLETSSLLIQPRPYTAIPASQPHELIEFALRASPQRWPALPDQVQRVLHELYALLNPDADRVAASLDSLQLGALAGDSHDGERICNGILDLVDPRF